MHKLYIFSKSFIHNFSEKSRIEYSLMLYSAVNASTFQKNDIASHE